MESVGETIDSGSVECDGVLGVAQVKTDQFGDVVAVKKFNPLIIKAVLAENQKDVVRYAKLGASVNAQDKKGMSCLHYASMKGSAVIVKWLLMVNADVEIRDAQRKTALHMACFFGHVDVLNLLVEFSGDLLCVDTWRRTLTHAAAQKNQCNILVRLDSLSALSEDATDVLGKTPADLARMHRNSDAEEFFKHPADRFSLKMVTHVSPRRLTERLLPNKVRLSMRAIEHDFASPRGLTLPRRARSMRNLRSLQVSIRDQLHDTQDYSIFGRRSLTCSAPCSAPISPVSRRRPTSAFGHKINILSSSAYQSPSRSPIGKLSPVSHSVLSPTLQERDIVGFLPIENSSRCLSSKDLLPF